MSFDKIVDAIIKEAMQRGEFENLPNRGKPIDLTDYFDSPEDIRVAYSILKNAGILPREAELLNEIYELKQLLATTKDEQKQKTIRREIEHKLIEFNLMMERNRHP